MDPLDSRVLFRGVPQRSTGGTAAYEVASLSPARQQLERAVRTQFSLDQLDLSDVRQTTGSLQFQERDEELGRVGKAERSDPTDHRRAKPPARKNRSESRHRPGSPLG